MSLRVAFLFSIILSPSILSLNIMPIPFGDLMNYGSITVTLGGVIYGDRDNIFSTLTGFPNPSSADLIAASLRRLRTTLEVMAHDKKSPEALEAIQELMKDTPLQLKLRELTKIFKQVEAFHENLIKYSQNQDKFERTTVENFAQSCVSHGPGSLPMIIERIHALIIQQTESEGGFVPLGIMDKLTTSLKQSSFKNICNYQQSPHQLLYRLLEAVIMTEIKGYTTMQYAWMLLKTYGHGEFKSETDIARINFEERINSTLFTFKSSMDDLSRDIIRCEPDHPKEGITYERITNFRQGYIENEINMGKEKNCDFSCKNHKIEKQGRCIDDTICQHQERCKGELESCTDLDANSDMTICYAPKGSERIYDWIQFDEDNDKISRDKRICSSEKHKTEVVWKSFFMKCSYCSCICNDKAGPKSDRYFSLKESVADIANNKVVTGLRFAKVGRIISLQISEGRLLQGGTVDSKIAWVPIAEERVEDQVDGVHYHELTKKERTVDLDDLEARQGYVLTGVRFKMVKGRLNFQIHTTPFNYSSGELVVGKSIWSHSQRSRSEIDIANLDVPIKSQQGSIPISHSGQYLKFEPTGFNVDLAQSTVPYIDLQPVVSKSPVPLAGAGLYYKGARGYGGFIAPKIITYDYGKHISEQFKVHA